MKKILFIAMAMMAVVASQADEIDYVHLDGFKIEPGEQKEVAINLAVPSGTDYMQITGNIFLPEGLSFVKAYGGRTKTYTKMDEDRCEGMSFLVSDIATVGDKAGSLYVALAGTPTVFIYHEDGYEDGAVFYITVKADENVKACGEIAMKYIVLTEVTDYRSHYLDDAMNYVTAPSTLAGIIENGVEDQPCYVTDALAVGHVTADGAVVYCKDDGGFALKDVAPYVPTPEQWNGDLVFESPSTFDQSNWVALKLPRALTAAEVSEWVGHRVSGIEGKLSNKLNPEIEVSVMPQAGEEATIELNTYNPANFVPQAMYFMPPKPQEVARVQWAVYSDGKFCVPAKTDKFNLVDADGVVAVENMTLYESDVTLADNIVYELTAVVQAKQPRVAAAQRRAGSVTPKDGTASAYYSILPITAYTDDVITGVDEVVVASEVTEVRYVSPAGIVSREPHSGVNIVVTRYTDGTQKTTKIVF